MDVNAIRKEFPLISNPENKDFIYFDNAATTQRPYSVLSSIDNFYKTANANPLRGLYSLSVKATDAYENARTVVSNFIHASSPREIIFTRNATESLNLISYSYALENVSEGDEIVVSAMEHHSNLLPWQMVCKAKNAHLVFLECGDDGVIPFSEYKEKITSKTKIVAITQVSNVFGITNPISEIAKIAHSVGNEGRGAVLVVDGAQSTPHFAVDVQALGADFFAFSGHKLCASMGIGVLFAKEELLSKMQPFLRGGEMIEYVTRNDATYAELPHKFEAGTVNAAGAVGLSSALEFLNQIGLENISAHDNKLASLLMEEMSKIPHVHIVGNPDPNKHCGIVTFTLDGVHPHDIASLLDTEQIAIRAGHHCAQPLMEKLNVGSTARASVYLYNTEDEVVRFVEKLSNVRRWMGFSD